MDASLSAMISNMQAMAAGNAAAPVNTAAQGTAAEGGESFGGILGGMMNVSAAEVVTAQAIPEKAEEEAAADMIMSPQTENALKNFISMYLAAKKDGSFVNADGTEMTAEQILEGLTESFGSLGSGEITKLASFSMEMETALFGGSKNDDEKDSAGDVLAGLITNIDMERFKLSLEEENDSVKSMYAAFSSVIITNDTSDVQFTLSPETEQLIADIRNAEETVITELSEDLKNTLEAIMADMPEEDAQTVRSFMNELENAQDKLSDMPDTSEVQVVSVKESGAENAEGQTAENDLRDMFGFGRFVRQTDTEKAVPKIDLSLGTDNASQTVDANAADAAAAELQNVPVETDPVTVFGSEENAADNICRQTTEQIMDKLMGRINENGTKELVFRLDPEGLGQIAVKLTKDTDGNLSVTLAAQNDSVAELLTKNTDSLSSMLTDKGSNVTSVNVVNAAEAGQYLDFDMNGGQNMFFANGTQQRNGRRGGFSLSSEGEEDNIAEISGIETAADDYIAKEAMLWTTA
ncbi:MAG: flagellar hook-length control protein FliK [Oscillospiraceae bacterium]|nr:flagellar hook-length control protein FliK [Oscillospiraceae bacterium]